MYVFNKEEVLKDWEMKLVYKAAYEDGLRYGRKLAIAKKLLENGVDIEIIAQATGLTVAEIEKLTDE
jgi:predicted transposase/invertase (TIGR01784 family)